MNTRMPRSILVALGLIGLFSGTGSAQTVEYYHLDALGSVRAVTNQSGAVIERHDFLPFGEELTPPVGGQPTQFTGQERDAETGMDYFGGRYYSGNRARFTSVDPVFTWQENLADPQRWNRYAYVRNNPLRYTDPDGRIPLDTLWDIGNVLYDVYTGATTGNWTDFKLDALAAAIPYVPAGVSKIRHIAKVDEAIDAAKSTGIVADIGKATDASNMVGNLPKPPRGKGTVPDGQRDPKRLFDPDQRAAKRQEQGGKCATGCGTTIDETNSRGHHKQRHADGGRTNSANHAEVCKDCHARLHGRQ